MDSGDVSGAAVKAVDYDSWGVKMSDSNSSFDLPVGFAGGILDAATGRWASKDPIFFRSGQYNLYSYALNNPVTFIDSNGQEPRTPGKGPPKYIADVST